jgi:hypothetical protein
MNADHVVILDGETGLVHILPWDPMTDEWEDEDFQEALEMAGINASSCQWMVVKRADFLRVGWNV